MTGPALARRLQRVSASPTQRVAHAADAMKRRGVDVIDLGAGEPDFATPAHIKAAGVAALDHDYTRYTPNVGLPELRHAICSHYQELYGIDRTPAQVIVSAGGKQALFNAIFALCDDGDEVITHAPGWPTIPEQVRLSGARAVTVRTAAGDGFRLHPRAVAEAITSSTKAIVLNSPGNPTGALMSESDLADIGRLAAAHGLWIVLDLCYEQLVYGHAAHNLPAVLDETLPEATVLVGSLSKSYAMTGWRCGWAIGPAAVIDACGTLQSHSTSNASSIAQYAGVAALRGSQACVAEMRDAYQERRDHLIAWLAAEPRIRCVRPGGAFYVFPDMSALLSPSGLDTSAAFADVLLDRQHVAVTPGEAFDAPGFLRLSYAASLEELREGIARLRRLVADLDRGIVPRRPATS